MKILLALVIFSAYSLPCVSQEVKNTSYKTTTGDMVLRFEVTIPVSKKEAWDYFTNDQLLKKWIAPLAHIELKTGGYILTNYDEKKTLSDITSIKSDILSYLEGELLTLKVNLKGNKNFAANVQKEDKNLQELIQFTEGENGSTKIISSMIGWGKGPDWDKTYKFFTAGNEWTYKEFVKLFSKPK